MTSTENPQGEDHLIKIIADYILSLRGVASLSYRDYCTIASWVDMCQNPDQLILILGELLPETFSDKDSVSRKKFKSLRSLDKKVQKSLNREAAPI